MRSAILILSFALAAPVLAQHSQLDVLDPAQAISRVAAAPNKSVRAVFQFRVQSAAAAHGGYHLNSQPDFHSPANLGVTVRPSAMPGLTRKYGQDLKAALVGKTIKVIGEVRRRSVAHGTATATEVEVTHAGQILSAT